MKVAGRGISGALLLALAACQTSSNSDGYDAVAGAGGGGSSGAAGRDAGAAGASDAREDGTSPAADAAGDKNGADARGDASDGAETRRDAPDGTEAGATVVATVDDNCLMADPGNASLARPMPVVIGKPVVGCLRGYTDKRFYQITPPASPAAGGYVVVTFRNVGQIAPDAFMFVAGHPAYIFEQSNGTIGSGLQFWFAVVPSVSYVMRVEDTYGFAGVPGTFTFDVAFTPVDDPYEPNDSKAQATPLTLGVPVQALMFRGYVSDSNTGDIGWWDFYRVALGAGAATVKLTHTPVDMYVEVYVYSIDDPLAGMAGTGTNAPNAGTDLTIALMAPLVPGNYAVVLEPYKPPTAWGAGATPGAFATSKYTLVVTQ